MKVDFNECIKSGVEQAMKECELTIGMTLKEAAEKQIPMKPVCIEDKMWTCGRCQNNLMFKWSRYPDILMPKEAGGTYCMECGQRIDWSEVE